MGSSTLNWRFMMDAISFVLPTHINVLGFLHLLHTRSVSPNAPLHQQSHRRPWQHIAGATGHVWMIILELGNMYKVTMTISHSSIQCRKISYSESSTSVEWFVLIQGFQKLAQIFHDDEWVVVDFQKKIVFFQFIIIDISEQPFGFLP